MNAPAPQPVTDYSAAGLAALRGSQKALPAELLEESSKRAAEEAPPAPAQPKKKLGRPFGTSKTMLKTATDEKFDVNKIQKYQKPMGYDWWKEESKNIDLEKE